MTRSDSPQGGAVRFQDDDTQPPVRLPQSLAMVLLQQLSSSQLRHLAEFVEERHRRSLDQAAAEELGDMLMVRREKPTIGWWSRYLSLHAAERRARIDALVQMGLAEGSSAVLKGAPNLEDVA